jgi:hypothetical protein
VGGAGEPKANRKQSESEAFDRAVYNLIEDSALNITALNITALNITALNNTGARHDRTFS